MKANAALCFYCVHTSVPKATDIYTGVARLDGLSVHKPQSANDGTIKLASGAREQQ